MPTYQNLGALNSTGTTIVLQTNASTGALLVDNGLGGDIPSNSIPFCTTGNTTASNTSITLTQAGVAGKQNFVAGYLVRIYGNTSTVATTGDITVQLQNGSANTVLTDIIGKGAAGGGGVSSAPGVPMFVGSANTNTLLVVTGANVSNMQTYATIWGYTV